jgi:rhamnosyltransferase
VRPEAHTWVRRDYALSFPERGDPPPWMYYSLPFAAIRRSAWREHPFYTDAWGSEDTEWGHWARTHGRRVRYVPESVVMHSHNYTLRQLYGRRFIEGEADAFIFRGRHGAGGMCARLVSSVARDLVQHARARDVVGLALAPARRAVSHWAYHQGHALGESRIARGDRDATRGQRVVLERHDAATPHTRATSS